VPARVVDGRWTFDHDELDARLATDRASLLLLCLTTGLGWRIPQPPLAVLAFMGLEWHVDAPLAVGDTIHSRSKTAVKRAMREGGVIIEERAVINQRGETVQHGKFTFLVARRPAPPAPQGDSA